MEELIKNNDEMYKLKKTINIEINDKKTNITNGIINLNDIECEKYFNTKIKINMKRMVVVLKGLRNVII